MRQFSTREEWLRACMTRVTAGWPVGADLPENTRISVGFPAKTGGRGTGRTSEHYRPSESEGGLFEIFISPALGEAEAVARAVALEAARIATGRTPSAVEMEALTERARAVVATMPLYPHSALKSTPAPKTAARATRLLKVECRECGYTARITRKWLREAVPNCPARSYHGRMEVEGSGT